MATSYDLPLQNVRLVNGVLSAPKTANVKMELRAILYLESVSVETDGEEKAAGNPAPWANMDICVSRCVAVKMVLLVIQSPELVTAQRAFADHCVRKPVLHQKLECVIDARMEDSVRGKPVTVLARLDGR